MIRLNVRKNDSIFRFGPPTWLNANDEPIAAEAVARILQDARVLILIHGYNVTDALDAYARVAENVEDLYDVIVGKTWPGSNKPGYWWAEDRADTAGRMLAEILGASLYKPLDIYGNFAAPTYRSLDIEGHSCGCRLALEAVKAGLKVRNLILAGAAVDNETVHADGKYGAAVASNTETTLVAYSRDDAVLKRAFRASSWVKRLVRFQLWGDDCKALGFTGPQDAAKCPPNVRAIDLTGEVRQHSEYKKRAGFFRAWRSLCAS